MAGLDESRSLRAEKSVLRFRLTFEASRGKAHDHLSDLKVNAARVGVNIFRQDIFEKDESNRWRRITAFITCFRLEANFCKIRTSKYLHTVFTDCRGRSCSCGFPPVTTRNSAGGYRRGIVRINDYPGTYSGTRKLLPSLANTERDPVLFHSITALFRRHTVQSVFHPSSLPGWRRLRPHGHRMSLAIFTWLLIESNWWLLVTQLESELQQLRQEATMIAGDQAFIRLTGLRRRLADAYGMLAETRKTVDNELKESYPVWNVERKALSAEEFWSEERAQRGKPVTVRRRRAQSMDIRDLPELLEELLERIKTMTQTVNEEIQMVIGSVQVEDARVMRRQTEWTVVFAVLAAIYLPMTLVTGIFGMNITEFGAEATAPDRWSVVKVWGIVFGATMGSVLVYAMMEYVLHYRRISRMLFRRMMRKIGDGWLYRRIIAFKPDCRDCGCIKSCMASQRR
jgi:hypothetical protein